MAFDPLSVGTLAAMPLIVVALAPRRWLTLSMTFALVSPVFFYSAVITWEMLTGPQDGNVPALAITGFGLLSAILLIPWLLICLAGFALGFGIRRLLRKRGARSGSRQQEPSVPGSSLTSQALETPPALGPAGEPATDMATWRSVHVGNANDGIRIGGVAVWKHRWRPHGKTLLRLAHPVYPHQIGDFAVFDAGDEGQEIQFAATELSNGVWGFYVAASDTISSQIVSTDGSLLCEHRVGGIADVGRKATATAVLRIAETGEVLAHCEAWKSSQIRQNADGSLFLHLRQDHFDVLFRIFPATSCFANQGEGGPNRPLSELADAVDAGATMAFFSSARRSRDISPDGSIRVDIDYTEWGNSHWVASPRLTETATGRILLDLWQTDWDAAVSFPGDCRVHLIFRRYRVAGTLDVELDIVRDTYQIARDEGQEGSLPAAPLSGVLDGLEASSLGSRKRKSAV